MTSFCGGSGSIEESRRCCELSCDVRPGIVIGPLVSDMLQTGGGSCAGSPPGLLTDRKVKVVIDTSGLVLTVGASRDIHLGSRCGKFQLTVNDLLGHLSLSYARCWSTLLLEYVRNTPYR